MSRFPLLGKGGFAEVYLGEHLHLKSQAAIKVLRTHLVESDAMAFLKEAQTIARLEHPHVVRVFDFDVQEETPFLVMSYMPNGTLRQHHPKDTPVPAEAVVSYLRQIAGALQYAHNQKVIHRDIKPENMLLDAHNNVVLSDFGIALTMQSSQQQGTQDITGTVAYMAPEQIHGRPRPASDQYSLGVVVYEWLCGSCPFQGSFTEIAIQQVIAPPPPLREKIPDLSPAVEEVVMKALAKDSQQRFASVEAFAAAFEQAYHAQRSGSGISVDSSNSILTTPLIQTAYSSDTSMLTGHLATEASTNDQVGTVSSLQRGIPRRLVLLGLAGITLVGGGMSWLVLAQKGQTLHGVSNHPPTPHSRSTSVSPASSSTFETTSPPLTTLASFPGYPDSSAGVTSPVRSLAWSPDGKYIACGNGDNVNTVVIRDAASGQQFLNYRGHLALQNIGLGIVGLAWSPNGNYIVTGTAGQAAHVWEALTGKHMTTYTSTTSGGVVSVAWSSDGIHIAASACRDFNNVFDNSVQVWHAFTGQNILTFRGHTNFISSLVWSPDGLYIASGSYDRTVQVWDVTGGKAAFTYRSSSAKVEAVSWSPGSNRIASAGDDKKVQVWDALTGENAITYSEHADTVTAVMWSPEGKRIVSGSNDGLVKVWVAA